MICTFQSTPATPIPLLPTAPISPAVNVPWPLPSSGLLLLLTKFQPIRSSGCEVSPSWVEPLAQPPTLVEASTSAAGDHAVAVGVDDLAGPLVDRVVQVGERDHAVAVDVGQVGQHAGGDLGLVEPELLIRSGWL